MQKMKKLIFLFVIVVLSTLFVQNLNAQTRYDFVIKFSSYKLPKPDGSWNKPVNKLSTLSFSKNGKGCIEYADKKYEFNFISIKPITYNWEESPNGFQLNIDQENFIMVSGTSDFALVNIKNICPYMNLLNWTNKDILGDVLVFYKSL